MKPYRFSPIKSENDLIEAIKYVHVQAHKLCKNTFGKYLEKTQNLQSFVIMMKNLIF